MKCKKCNKKFDGYLDQSDRDHIKKDGLCGQCFVDSKGLIKVDNHYVPWNYRFYTDTEEPVPKNFHEDVHAKLPELSWCDKFNKFKLVFVGADFGGYEACPLTWYFDSKEEILEELGFNKK